MSTTVLVCPACGVDALIDTPTEPPLEEEPEAAVMRVHGEDILGIPFEMLRDIVEKHVRTPMSIPALGAVLRMRGLGNDPDPIQLRVALTHAHVAGVIHLRKAWSWSGYSNEPWVKDLAVFADPPAALIRQNCETA